MKLEPAINRHDGLPKRRGTRFRTYDRLDPVQAVDLGGAARGSDPGRLRRPANVPIGRWIVVAMSSRRSHAIGRAARDQ